MEYSFGILFVIWIINRFPKVLNNRILKLINMYSMDIYLYGVPVNYIIMTMLIHIDDATHMNNITSLFLYVLRIFYANNCRHCNSKYIEEVKIL